MNFSVRFITIITASLAFVAAFAWNSAIKQFISEAIDPLIPGNELLSKFIYALVVTMLAVIVTYQLAKLSSHLNGK